MSELLEALGADVEVTPTDESGYYNLQTIERALKSIKPVTNEAAKMLVFQARAALDKAVALANPFVGNTFAMGPIPLKKEIVAKQVLRDEKDVRSHLKWHADRIGSDPLDVYPAGDDLKKYFSLAFRTYNVALDGEKTAESITFYHEVLKVIADYIQKGKEYVKKSSNWLALTLGVVAVGAVGYGWYNLKMAKYKYGPRLQAHDEG
jgi:hypothetical protein